MSKKVKTFAIVVGVIIALIILLKLLAGGDKKPATGSSPLATSADGSRVATSTTLSEREGAGDFAILLSSVKNINIDTTIFNNLAYRSLRDYPLTLGTDIMGRPNPFAPIGSDQGAGVSTTASSGPLVQTLQPGKITKNAAEFGAQVTLADTVPVNVVFEYGVNDTFGNMTTPVQVTKSGTTLITISNLLPQTKYVMRAIVVRGGTTTTGTTIPFTTL